jgi:hypothetical protein
MSSPVIDTFLFSEAHEADILLAKLHIEQDIVDRWVAVENAFTIKGQPKPVELRALLSADPRFAPFLDRLDVVTIAENFPEQFRVPAADRRRRAVRQGLARVHAGSRAAVVAYAEAPYFYAEAKQRDAALDRVLAAAGGADALVCVSDVDEILDGSHPRRRHVVAQALKADAAVVHFDRRRFAYDIDNMVLGGFRSIPAVRTSALSRGLVSLGRVRLDPQGVVASPEPVAFEYSYCYGLDGLRRKLETFTHLDPGASVVDRALEYNHQLKLVPATSVPHFSYWHERVDPEAAGHPEYVLDHFEELRTGAVNPDYAAARRRAFPQVFPGPC